MAVFFLRKNRTGGISVTDPSYNRTTTDKVLCMEGDKLWTKRLEK